MITNELRRRFRFFHEHAGYVVGARARGALALARAEQWAEDEGIEFLTRDDDERAYCYCDDPHCKYHEGSEYERDHGWETIGVMAVRPCPEHGTDCKHAEVLGSLWGIMEPDNTYLRVVRAELALEAQS